MSNAKSTDEKSMSSWMPSCPPPIRALFLLLPIVVFHSSFADIVTLHPSADTTLHEYFPDNNLGAQLYFNAGTTQNGPRTRGLMQFDISGSLPAGAIIHSVSLTLEVTKQPVDGDAPSNFALHRMLVAWGEGSGIGQPPFLGAPAQLGEACWNSPAAMTAAHWGAPGGLAGVDFAAQRSADTFIYGVNFSPYTFGDSAGLISDVQSWLDHPQSNFGWMMLTESEDEIFSARRFASREAPFLAPTLEIDFTPVPEPSVALLAAMMAGAWLWRKNITRALAKRTSSRARRRRPCR
jgi:hypothetical protein